MTQTLPRAMRDRINIGEIDMKRKSLFSFFTGAMTTVLVVGCITTALAASNVISFNRVNLSMGGEIMFMKDEYLETEAGQKIPSSILYTDELGGGTTYLPAAYISKLLGVQVSWDAETDTVVLESGSFVITPPDDFLLQLAEQWLVDGDYPKNGKGETYGPEVLSELLGHQPDLISAAATNGKEGYVRREDFMLEPSEIETNGKPFMIPVYDLEGNVIGEFELNR